MNTFYVAKSDPARCSRMGDTSVWQKFRTLQFALILHPKGWKFYKNPLERVKLGRSVLFIYRIRQPWTRELGVRQRRRSRS